MSRVLIVHADAAIGTQLAATLTAAGFTTSVVTSGERAMDRFIQEPADVVVIDYDLDGRDGIATAEAIRWMPGGRRARVILTALEEPEDESLEALAQTVDAFTTLVGRIDGARLELEVSRAAAVRPHEAETRVLSTELALMEAERARASGYGDRTAPEGEVLGTSLPLTMPHSSEDPAAFDLDDTTLDEPVRAAWELGDPDGRAEGREVRAIAEAAQHTHSDTIGSFEQIAFARVLHRLAEKRATGALICVHPPDERATTEGTEPTKVVYFRAGVPVHVRSNLVTECLGQVLTRQRKIGPATLRESLSAMRRGEGRQGELLLRMGAIAPLDLSMALAEQLRVKLFEIFGWRRGTFRLALNRTPPDELIDIELGLAEIAYLGVREGIGPHRALDLLEPHQDFFVVPQPRAMVRFVRLHVDEMLAELIRRIDGSRRLSDILKSAPSPGEAAQLIHAMECLDAVRFEPKPPRSVVPREPSRSVHLDTVEEVRATLPSVPEGAVLAESSTQWDAEDGETPVESPPDVDRPREMQVEPSERGEESHDEPSHARAEPSHETASREARQRSANESAAEPASARGSERPPDLPSASGELADRPEASRSSAADLAPSPTRLERPSRNEPEQVSPSPGPRSAGPPSAGPPSAGPPSAGPPSPDLPSPDLPSKEKLDARVKRLLHAERYSRRGQRALDRDKPDEAMEVFAKAAELCPDEGPFLAQLAWAKHLAAADDTGLDELLDLVERGCANAPDSALPHILRARLLRAAGRDREAEAAYRRALSLDPDDAEAKREAKP